MERPELLQRFVLRELIRVGHAYQIVMAVMKENSKDFPPSLDQGALFKYLSISLESLLKMTTETFDGSLIEEVEAEIMKSYEVVQEVTDGNQGQTQQEE